MNSSNKTDENSNCVYCGESVRGVEFSCIDIRRHKWSWGKCNACGTYSLLPRPTDSDLSLAYDSTYYGSSETKFEGLSERFLSYCRGMRARRLAAGLPVKARILDIGCGNGEFLAALSKFGDFELWGTELSGPAANRTTKHPQVNLKVGRLEVDDFDENAFDMVTLFHVFEHLPNPSETLEIIRKILKPNGHLVMSFPNIASWQAGFFKNHWLHLDPPRHLFLMPPETFEREVQQFGFEVVSRRFFSIEQNPYGLIQSILNKAGLPRDLLYERLKGNNEYAPKFGKASLLGQKLFAALCFLPAICLDVIESMLGKGATVQYKLRLITQFHDR